MRIQKGVLLGLVGALLSGAADVAAQGTMFPTQEADPRVYAQTGLVSLAQAAHREYRLEPPNVAPG